MDYIPKDSVEEAQEVLVLQSPISYNLSVREGDGNRVRAQTVPWRPQRRLQNAIEGIEKCQLPNFILNRSHNIVSPEEVLICQKESRNAGEARGRLLWLEFTETKI